MSITPDVPNLLLGGRVIFSGGDWSFWLPSPPNSSTSRSSCVAVCARSDLAALGLTSAVADRPFYQEMDGLRSGKIRHLGGDQSDRN
jgi:hypothetical protein